MVRCTVCTSSCRLSKCSSSSGVSLSFCAGGQWGFSVGHFEVFLMKEKTKTAGKIDGEVSFTAGQFSRCLPLNVPPGIIHVIESHENFAWETLIEPD